MTEPYPTQAQSQTPAEPAPKPIATVYSGDPTAGVDPQVGATLVSQDPAPAVVEPPVNVDVPLVYQDGALLTCTLGNWEGVPTSYAYQWQTGGNVVGSNQANYTVTPEMVGYAVTCSVTATNAGGQASATSSEWTVTDPLVREAPAKP